MIRLPSTTALGRLRAELEWARIEREALLSQRDRLASQVTDAYVARSLGDEGTLTYALARAAETVRRIKSYDDLQKVTTP